jgi:microcystin degradation protein MlrC
MRIAIAGLQHETNTFAPGVTEAADFLTPGGWPRQVRGVGMISELSSTSVPTAGALDVLRRAKAQPVPLLWTIALPSGPVRHAAFTDLADEIIARLSDALPVDGVFLELHGAMVTTEEDDAEGALLERVRDALGPNVPLVVALDLHCNLSLRMMQAADRLFAYLTYPHVDMAATGARAMACLLHLAQGGARPAKAFRQLPYLLPLVAQYTGSDPVRRLYDAADDKIMVTMGFPLADVADAGPTLVAYADTQTTADETADAMLAAWANAEGEFDSELWGSEAAVARAMAARDARQTGPIVLADVQDNPGGGGANDTTGLLHALLAARAVGALMVHIADGVAAEAAHSAGQGATLDIAIGGASDPETGAPVPGLWRVERLGSGDFIGSGPMYAGNAISMGPVALLEQSGVRVIVAGHRMQASEPELIRHLGIEPREVAILCVKSSVHFRGAYESMAKEILLVAAPGRVTMDLAALRYTKSKRRPARATGHNEEPKT